MRRTLSIAHYTTVVHHAAAVVLSLTDAQHGPATIVVVLAPEACRISRRRLLPADTCRAAVQPTRTAIDAPAHHGLPRLPQSRSRRGGPRDHAREEPHVRPCAEDVQCLDPILGYHARYPRQVAVVLVRLEGCLELPCHSGHMGKLRSLKRS